MIDDEMPDGEDIDAMQAHELIQEYVKEDKQEDVGVIAIEENEDDDLYWYHVHGDEEVPEDATVAFHPRDGDGDS